MAHGWGGAQSPTSATTEDARRTHANDRNRHHHRRANHHSATTTTTTTVTACRRVPVYAFSKNSGLRCRSYRLPVTLRAIVSSQVPSMSVKRSPILAATL